MIQAEALGRAGVIYSIGLPCAELSGQVRGGQEIQTERTIILQARPAIEWQQPIALHRMGAAWSCAFGVAWHLQAGQQSHLDLLCRRGSSAAHCSADDSACLPDS